MKRGSKSHLKSMPFKSHKKRKAQKLFTVKVVLLCISLTSIILMENEIVKFGKAFLKAPKTSKQERVFASYADLKLSDGFQERITKDLKRAHEVIHKKTLPTSHLPSEKNRKTEFSEI